MTENVEFYQKMVVKALKSAKKYTKSLDIQIMTLASALRTLNLANEEIDKLDCTYVMEETRYGSKMAPHPVFKIQKDAQDSVTRQMKSLGLTAAELSADTDADPLVDLTKEVKKTGTKPVIIMPDLN